MTPLAATGSSPWGCAFVGLLSLAVVAVVAIDRSALWMARRGWIRWRRPKHKWERESSGGGGAMAGILTEFQRIIEPQTQSRIEIIEERRTESGERAVRGDGVDPPLSPNQSARAASSGSHEPQSDVRRRTGD
jgi:hypothetical protein